MSVESENLDAARRYLATLEKSDLAGTLKFFTPDVVQEEFPNRLAPNGAKRDLDGLREAAERGRRVMSAQTFDVINAVAIGNQVVLEVRWTGTLTIGFASIPAGGQMHARFAVFLEFRDGKILRQRNYDCFEPW
jgi:ketosteroid isomerase-like protein